MFVSLCAGADVSVFILNKYALLRSCGYLWKVADLGIFEHFLFNEDCTALGDYSDTAIYIKHGYDDKGKRYIFNGEKLKPISDQKLKKDLGASPWAVVGDYCYRKEMLKYPTENHIFKHALTGAEFSYIAKYFGLLTIIGDVFYFECDNSIVGFDGHFQEVFRHSFTADRTIISQYNGVALVFQQNPNLLAFVEAFDLQTGKVMASQICSDSKAWSMSLLSESNAGALFACGKELLLWNGQQFSANFPEKRITGYILKDDFTYVSFEEDPYVYAYSLDCTKLLGRQLKPVADFDFYSFEIGRSCNFAFLCFANRKVAMGLSYFVQWTDAEFFSDTPWTAVVEKPIFSEEKVAVGEHFALCVHVDAREAYPVVARQALAGLDQALHQHAAFMGVPCSLEFTGAMELCFEHSLQLSAEQRQQLEQAAHKLLTDNYSNFTGAATGLPCSLSVSFID